MPADSHPPAQAPAGGPQRSLGRVAYLLFDTPVLTTASVWALLDSDGEDGRSRIVIRLKGG